MTAPRQLNRHKRRTALGGSIALLAVLGAGAATVNQAFADTPDPSSARTHTRGDATVPASGRSITAALYAAVNDIADGTVDRVRGGMMSRLTDDSTGKQITESVNGSFAFTPAGASSPGEISASIYHKAEGGKIWDMFVGGSCPSGSVDCQHTTLPDGSEVTSYRWHGEGDGKYKDPAGGDVVVVERTLGDVKVVVTAANGMDSPILGGAELPNLPQAVLSAEQLKEIVSQPWWGLELPAEFSGDDLPSFKLLPGGAGSL